MMLLGRYQLGPEIGRGGMSTVYRGEDTQLRRPVALKLLAPHLSADLDFRRRLLAEAHAAARLPHPHVVQVLDAGTAEDGTVVLVMELVEGEPLQERLRRGSLVVDEACEIAAQVAEALAAAHARGIVHRDVKPGNVLLARPVHGASGIGGGAVRDSLHAKLADFGIARSLDATSTFTAAGMVMGSAPYIAPEVLEGHPADARADIYALGVTLFQMLAGRLPFQAQTASASLAARLAAEAPRVRTFRSDIPPWLDLLIARCIVRDPDARFVDAGRLARALRDAGATFDSEAPTQAMASPPLSPRVPTPTNAPRARSWPRRWAPGAAIAAIALVAALGIAGAAVNGNNATVTARPTTITPAAAVPPATATPNPTPTAGPAEAPSPTAIVIRLR